MMQRDQDGSSKTNRSALEGVVVVFGRVALVCLDLDGDLDLDLNLNGGKNEAGWTGPLQG